MLQLLLGFPALLFVPDAALLFGDYCGSPYDVLLMLEVWMLGSNDAELHDAKGVAAAPRPMGRGSGFAAHVVFLWCASADIVDWSWVLLGKPKHAWTAKTCNVVSSQDDYYRASDE